MTFRRFSPAEVIFSRTRMLSFSLKKSFPICCKSPAKLGNSLNWAVLKINGFTHNVVGEPLTFTSVNDNATVIIALGNVNRRTLHFGVSKAKLGVDVIDVLEEIRKIPSSCSNRNVVSRTQNLYFEETT